VRLIENEVNWQKREKGIVLKLIKTCEIQYTGRNDFILAYGT
jgi:hypothetical protein